MTHHISVTNPMIKRTAGGGAGITNQSSSPCHCCFREGGGRRERGRVLALVARHLAGDGIVYSLTQSHRVMNPLPLAADKAHSKRQQVCPRAENSDATASKPHRQFGSHCLPFPRTEFPAEGQGCVVLLQQLGGEAG